MDLVGLFICFFLLCCFGLCTYSVLASLLKEWEEENTSPPVYRINGKQYSYDDLMSDMVCSLEREYNPSTKTEIVTTTMCHIDFVCQGPTYKLNHPQLAAFDNDHLKHISKKDFILQRQEV